MKIKNLIPITLSLLAGVVYGQSASTSGDYIMLVDPLDEPEFYCFDLAGWGQSLQLDDPLQTHTCKTRNAADQMFHFDGNRLKASEYDRCLQVAGSSETTLPGSAVLVRPCSEDNALQEARIDDEGKIRLMDPELCLVAGVESLPASGPSHMWRTLTVAKCESADPALSVWQLGMD